MPTEQQPDQADSPPRPPPPAASSGTRVPVERRRPARASEPPRDPTSDPAPAATPEPDEDDTREQLTVDMQEFTNGELEEIEEAFKVPFSEFIAAIFDPGKPSMKYVTLLLLILKRRDEPGFTLEDARAMRASEFRFDWGNVGGDDDPTLPPDDGEPDG